MPKLARFLCAIVEIICPMKTSHIVQPNDDRSNDHLPHLFTCSPNVFCYSWKTISAFSKRRCALADFFNLRWLHKNVNFKIHHLDNWLKLQLFLSSYPNFRNTSFIRHYILSLPVIISIFIIYLENRYITRMHLWW